MLNYRAPVDDYRFLLHVYLRVQERSTPPDLEGLDPEFTAQILNSVARFHEGVLHPLNASGDASGARLRNGQVQTPRGFADAWQEFQASGWIGAALPEAIGGGGLPPLLGVPIEEFGMATAHSFKMYAGFCAPTAFMLSELGDAWMRQHVVPRLVNGDWTATMSLTESHCGTDLRQLRTRATQHTDGTWRVNGTKIFISGGDHDLTDNIVHVVLAKIPDAQGRIRNRLEDVGVFLVSKREIDPTTGSLGEPRGVCVSSIEHKMGIEGNATCVLNFEEARAWRIAGPERQGSSAGMYPMFLLMNHARLGTGISGISYAELAWQNAASYARDRRSGRVAGSNDDSGPADAIVAHPDVRRMLLETRAFVEGARATTLQVALLQSVAASSPDPAERARAHDIVEVMTPVIKAYFTDKGFEAANACLQVFGGHGYVRETGMEQLVRNARIGQIYEGTNGVQAFDLAARKLKAGNGRALMAFGDWIEGSLQRTSERADLDVLRTSVRHGLDLVLTANTLMQAQAREDASAVAAAAYDLLTMVGTLVLGSVWLDMAALDGDSQVPSAFRAAARSKKVLARVWIERQLPLLDALHARIAAGPSSLMALTDEDV